MLFHQAVERWNLRTGTEKRKFNLDLGGFIAFTVPSWQEDEPLDVGLMLDILAGDGMKHLGEACLGVALVDVANVTAVRRDGLDRFAIKWVRRLGE